MNEEMVALVRRAQAGDAQAFGRLVERFQDMAYYTAYRTLGDRQQAEDAAQEAFLDAYRYLPALRDPIAFPAWLRRIVFKHCDRQFRGQRATLFSIDDEEREFSADSLSPDAMLERLQHEQAIRTAVEQLPPTSRQAITLFYLQGHSYQETAARLDVPLTTLKKRLHAARRLLKERIRPMRPTTQTTYTTYRPSEDETFANRVKFYIALRNNDLLQVRQLARRSPELLSARTEWGIGSEGYYWPLGATPLHWAAGAGNRPLAEVLLELGADINALDVNGNTPLKRATHMNQAEMVSWLLEQDADPNVAASNGQTPLHVAIIRAEVKRFDKPRYDLAEALLVHGADPTVRDSQGRTAGEWAAVKGLTTLAQRLGSEETVGPAIFPASQPEPGAMWQTGIKIIDLLAPLKWGGRNGIFTPLSGIGINVLVGELIHRIAFLYGGRAVHIARERGGFNEEGRRLQWRNSGVEEYVENFFAREGDSAARCRHVAEQGVRRALELAAAQPVLFIAYTDLALSEGVMELLSDLHARPDVTILFDGIESIGAEPPALASLDAALTFYDLRAHEGLWPAIDPLRSYSSAYSSETHASVATAARRLFARYHDLNFIYQRQGMAGFDMALYGEAERQAVIRARRLHRFLSQPLYVAEPWSATPAEYVPLAETLKTSQAILAGEMDDVAEEALLNIGSWSPRWM
jgi:RNA polymerase sigma-70 factor (ECF subfamily)